MSTQQRRGTSHNVGFKPLQKKTQHENNGQIFTVGWQISTVKFVFLCFTVTNEKLGVFRVDWKRKKSLKIFQHDFRTKFVFHRDFVFFCLRIFFLLNNFSYRIQVVIVTVGVYTVHRVKKFVRCNDDSIINIENLFTRIFSATIDEKKTIYFNNFRPYLNLADRDLGFSSISLSSATIIRFSSISYRCCFSARFCNVFSSRFERNSSGRRTIPWKCRLMIRSSNEWKLMQSKMPLIFNKLKTKNVQWERKKNEDFRCTCTIVRDHCKVRWVHHSQRFLMLEKFVLLDESVDWVYRRQTNWRKRKRQIVELNRTLFFKFYFPPKASRIICANSVVLLIGPNVVRHWWIARAIFRWRRSSP